MAGKDEEPGLVKGERLKLRASIVDTPAGSSGTYSNFAVASHSLHELVIDFALVAPTADSEYIAGYAKEGILPATHLFRVRMPPPMARGLVSALEAQLQLLEAGEVFQPSDEDED